MNGEHLAGGHGADEDHSGEHHSRGHRAGGYALVLGVLAVLCALIPVIGDLVAVPLALFAVVLGVIGVGHYDSGRAPRMLPSVLGALLGAIALLLVVVAVLASSPLG
ncbi:hypothetical protein [Brachybacterium sp.]|uniref:hypothetical protein n=1 Tax=Brachybacterium sp. TaxID=1891286 RepID=UPI002ED4430E